VLHLLSKTHDFAPYVGRQKINFQGRIKMEAVSFRYGEAPLLHDINLEMKPEDAVAIVGANGVGKTTLLLTLLGRLPPLAGAVAGRVPLFYGWVIVAVGGLAGAVTMRLHALLEFDGAIEYTVALTASQPTPVRDIQIGRAHV
jgi:energy-coupling factor transporter ATP-binding protein EcfA2